MSLKDTIAGIIVDGALFKRFVRGTADETITTEAGQIPTLAGINNNATAAMVAAMHAVSASSLTVALGRKVFTISATKVFKPGQWVSATVAGASMTGTVTSYTGTALELNVTQIKGTGTHANWAISPSGPPGKDGRDGVDGKDGTGSGSGGAPVPVLITKFPWET